MRAGLQGLKKGAAGPDSIALLFLLKCLKYDIDVSLTNVFNPWQFTGQIPECVKVSKLVLFPEEKINLHNVKN